MASSPAPVYKKTSLASEEQLSAKMGSNTSLHHHHSHHHHHHSNHQHLAKDLATNDPLSEASSYINSVVSQNCVVIFSKTGCPYSTKAKKVFDDMGICYFTVELNERNDGEKLQAALLTLSGARTVPRVFINGSCIGGGMDTEKLYQEGKLAALLAKCSCTNW